MDAATFIVALRRTAGPPPEYLDPLARAQAFLERHGNTGEGRAFRRVIRALITGEGHFTEAELYSFSSKSLRIISDLMEANDLGRYSTEEWLRIG